MSQLHLQDIHCHSRSHRGMLELSGHARACRIQLGYFMCPPSMSPNPGIMSSRQELLFLQAGLLGFLRCPWHRPAGCSCCHGQHINQLVLQGSWHAILGHRLGSKLHVLHLDSGKDSSCRSMHSWLPPQASQRGIQQYQYQCMWEL